MSEEWLEFLKEMYPIFYDDAMQSITHAAAWRDQIILDNKLPAMVEITETSYPADGQEVLMYDGRKTYNAVGVGMYLPSLRGYWFRPLGPSDRPPQEKTNV